MPGVPPPPMSPDHVRAKYVNQRNSYISFFALYLLLVLWSLMKLFVTYKLDKVHDEPPPLPPKGSADKPEAEAKKEQ